MRNLVVLQLIGRWYFGQAIVSVLLYSVCLGSTTHSVSPTTTDGSDSESSHLLIDTYSSTSEPVSFTTTIGTPKPAAVTSMTTELLDATTEMTLDHTSMHTNLDGTKNNLLWMLTCLCRPTPSLA